MIASNKEIQLYSATSSFSESNESNICLQSSQMVYDSGYNQQLYSDSLSYNSTPQTNKNNSYAATCSYSSNDYDRTNLAHLSESYASFMIPNGILLLFIVLLIYFFISLVAIYLEYVEPIQSTVNRNYDLSETPKYLNSNPFNLEISSINTLNGNDFYLIKNSVAYYFFTFFYISWK